MIRRPRERSTKKTNGSGGKGKFNPDCFFDMSALAAIILGQFVNGLTCLVTLRDNARRYAGQRQLFFSIPLPHTRLLPVINTVPSLVCTLTQVLTSG